MNPSCRAETPIPVVSTPFATAPAAVGDAAIQERHFVFVPYFC